MIKFEKEGRSLLLALLIIFIITEIVDDLFDHLLGNSIIHSIFQLFLFLILFLMVARLFLSYHKSRINALIPDELMNILKVINCEGEKGVLVNQVTLMKSLDVTKPTMKKRLRQLIDFGYVSVEEKGNNKYIKLTPLGGSIIR